MLINWARWCERIRATAKPGAGEQRQLALLSKGMRLHARFIERSDCCSLAVLDRSGVVVVWYDGAPGTVRSDDTVLHRHVSQFYTPGDVAAGVLRCSLRSAAAHGSDTQHGWRRRPAGAVYWGTTVLETIEDGAGRRLGFAHVTRPSHGPRGVSRTALRQQRRTRVRRQWSLGGMAEPGLVAV